MFGVPGPLGAKIRDLGLGFFLRAKLPHFAVWACHLCAGLPGAACVEEKRVIHDQVQIAHGPC